jgi:predicted amidohydrolase YtcJ
MVTIDVAYALHNEINTGSIEVGKQADMIVLDRDITQTPLNNIGSTRVLATMVAGKVVYDTVGLYH